MKIIDNLKDGYEILKKNNISSYKIDCEILMSKTLNISREEVLLNLEKNVKKEDKETYFNLINRRKKNEPIAYITNYKSFWKNKFITNKNVLIPRPDSEHLVEQALKLIKNDQSKRILDIGVGSGCLSISILNERLNCKCDAIDPSKNAFGNTIEQTSAEASAQQERIRQKQTVERAIGKMNTGDIAVQPGGVAVNTTPNPDQLKEFESNGYRFVPGSDGGGKIVKNVGQNYG